MEEDEDEDGHTVVATARGIFNSNGGVLSSIETGVSIIIPQGAIPEGIEQEIYFKVCRDNSILPPLDKEKGMCAYCPFHCNNSSAVLSVPRCLQCRYRDKLEASKYFRPSTAFSVDNTGPLIGAFCREVVTDIWWVGPQGGRVAFYTEYFYFLCEIKKIMSHDCQALCLA